MVEVACKPFMIVGKQCEVVLVLLHKNCYCCNLMWKWHTVQRYFIRGWDDGNNDMRCIYTRDMSDFKLH